MVLERYRSGWDAGLAPLARRMHQFGITPNNVTAVSFVFAILAALAFYLSAPGRTWLLFAGAAAVSANAILDGLDGKLARITNTSSRRGDYLDHVVDRYSDLVILLGLTLSPYGHATWGLFAIVGTFLTSYMGTQAQAIGLTRNYAGLLGRADRLVILIAVPALMYLAELAGYDATPWGIQPVAAMLAYFAVVGNITALQRFWAGWRDLREA